MQTSHSSTCPTCKSPIAADAPSSLCPACTLEKAATVAHSTSGGRRSSPAAIAEIAPHFPELEILELIGAGGMGAVYKARQPQLDRTIALKILSHDLAQDPAFVERFNREARVLGRLSHPNIVAIFDFGTAGPFCYLLMEYVDGVNLRQALRTGGFKPAEALSLVRDVCAALQFAHEEGILHRDIKPENILIDSKGRVKIADFGIAKLVGENHRHDVTLTIQGAVLGSPHYMAPEQIESPGDVDQRADIYSLGVVLYEMLTGELPIGRFSLPSEKARLDARIDEIVMRTLEKERERRYQTVSELKTGFEGIEGPAVPSPSPLITDQILDFSKYTLRIALIFLMLLFINMGSSFSDNTDDLLKPSRMFLFLTGATICLSTVSAVLRIIHTMRTQGQQTASLGLTAAIVTAISLLFAGVTLSVANILSDTDTRLIAMVLGVSLDGILAILGFVLGASALGDIRKSGGTKDGLGFAIFAVVPWPIGFMAVLILSSLMVPMTGRSGGGISASLALLLVGIPLLLASFMMIRGLRRWARGVEMKDGPRHFPGLTGTVLATLGLAMLGPVLAAVIPTLFPASGSHDRFAEIESEMNREMRETKPVSAAKQWTDSEIDLGAMKDIDWQGGRPDLTWKITVESGLKAEMRLILKDEDGSIRLFDLGECATQINGAAGQGRLDVGTVPPNSDEAVSDIHAMTVAFQAGRKNKLIHSFEDLRGYHFFDSHQGELVLDGAGTQIFPFATRFADGQQQLATGTLSLEAIVKGTGEE